MKKTRRIAAMAAAMTLAFGTAVPASMFVNAAVTIETTDSVNAAHTYTAYQIFTGEFTEGVGLTVNGWGTGFNYSGLLADEDFTGLSVGGGKTIGDEIGASTDAAVAAQAIEKFKNNGGLADVLAAVLYKYIGTGTPIVSGTTVLGIGYWLVGDSYTTTADPANDAVSKHILKVANSEAITITTKKSFPSVQKKVKENVKRSGATADAGFGETEKEWNDVADYNIGDKVPFKLYATMPSTLDDYKCYYIKFTDTLGPEFTVDNDTEFTIKVDGTKVGYNRYNIHVDKTTGSTGTVIGIAIEDIKALKDTTGAAINVTKDSVITVEYEAVLNTDAKIGRPGQENKVDLTYSNNPNVEYNPKTDSNNPNEEGPGTDNPDTPEDESNTPSSPIVPETPGTPDQTDTTPGNPVPESPKYPDTPATPPSDDNPEGTPAVPGGPATDKTKEDKVIVFTYELDVKKTDSATGNPLAEAKFKMYKNNGTTKEYLIVTDGIITWGTEAQATVLESDADGKFSVKGIDDGTYYLVETEAPEGYNLDSTPKELVIAAGTANVQNWTTTADDALTSLKLNTTETTDTAKGKVETTITNTKGLTLPETGGLGTKLFSIFGSVAAAGAGVVLMAKKRMKNEQ